MRALLLAAALLAAAAAGPARAGSLPGADDLAEIRQVIRHQIDALRHGDAEGAFALVAPRLQKVFRTPQRFLEVMRMAYRAVYRPREIRFLGAIPVDGDVVQPVRLTDKSGRAWVAYYTMQRQKDGSWRTEACHLAHPPKSV